MNQKRLFKGLAISIALIIVVGIFMLQEVTELPTPTPTLEVGSISFKFESYAKVNFVMP